MAWIPPGALVAGTPPDRAPRIAEEELPGVAIPMDAFYIDLLPFPDEPGAIPTTNVGRDEAARLCEGKSKRLCTELEWERACKGPDGRVYEYGDAYRASACTTGIKVEESSKRPSGDRLACKSGFGVSDMHGGVWEWTESSWGRASKDPDLGVLKGGNAVAGELVGRCANGIGRAISSKGPTLGFRCCAGPKNDAKVDLALTTSAPLERSVKPEALAAPFVPLAARAWGDAAAFTFTRAWTWHPVPNEELVIAGGCAKTGHVSRCGLLVGRSRDGATQTVAQFEVGHDLPEVAQFGEARRLRARGADAQGGFTREITYTYGRIEIGEAKR